MESFNRGEHVDVAFLDVEKAFDNVWHNGHRNKIFMLDLPTKTTRWFSDFLVHRIIQVKNGFLSNQINRKAGVLQDSVLNPLLFLIYVNDFPTPHHKQNSLSQFANHTAQWAFSLNIRFAAKRLQQDLLNLARVVCQMENQTESRENQSHHILQVQTGQNYRTQPETVGEILKVYNQVEFLGITFDSQLIFQGNHGSLQHQVPSIKTTIVPQLSCCSQNGTL